MSLLSAADLASMRAVLNESLPETAVIQSRGTSGDDAGGGGTLSWLAVGTVDARVAPIGGDERELASRIAENANWVITFPATTTVEADDRVVVGSRTFNILHLRAPRSYELSKRAECNEVT